MSDRKSYTGLTRRRQTRAVVRAMDWLARTVITVGGIGTIVAVLLVLVFLVSVVAPIFQGSAIGPVTEMAAPWSDRDLAHFEVNEYRAIGWALHRSGRLDLFDATSGDLLGSASLTEDAKATAISVLPDRQTVAFGFADGTARIGSVKFDARLLEPDAVPAESREKPVGVTSRHENGVIEKTPQAQFRFQTVVWTLGPALELAPPVAGGDSTAASAVTQLDSVPVSGGILLAVLNGDGQLRIAEVVQKTNLLTDETTTAVEAQHMVPLPKDDGPPIAFQWIGRGEHLLVGWRNGWMRRYDTRTPSRPTLVDEVRAFDDEAELTALGPILGRSTIIAGDSQGRLTGWFIGKQPSRQPGGDDVLKLFRAKNYPRLASGVQAIRPSTNSRTFLAATADGRLALYQATVESRLLEIPPVEENAVARAIVSPRDDEIYAASEGVLRRWPLDKGHPEATPKALFRPVWYEGYAAPQQMWQSTGGSNDAEVKLGVMPLVFGSLKATFYSMLIGAPLALLAAVYTSEFLDRKHRSRVKPAVELMASLPSVVLGFLAALVFAPVVERLVPSLVAGAVTVPVSIFVGGYLWQILPKDVTVRMAPFRLLFVGLSLLAGIGLAAALGPSAERWLFNGNLIHWLDGSRGSELGGSGWGGWFVLLLPLTAVLTAYGTARFVTPALIARFGDRPRTVFATIELTKFLTGVLAAGLMSAGIAGLLTAVGLDPRGTLLGTYAQRNALIVGFVMGFAIIPIIYTIADDALMSVPASLRSASLGAGATPWQTAVRIVIPTAMSGLFSALMVGLGRAVGETMIVLMAGGNTPLMDLNPFNGFRTLSANIATELADAVRNSTHYRTLFFTALTLFVLTFLVNTFAEFVRMRFRRRVYQL